MEGKGKNCGYVEVDYPVDTAGNNKIWVCYCKYTACMNMTGAYTHITPLVPIGQYFLSMAEHGAELTPEEEDKFYKKVMKTKLI